MPAINRKTVTKVIMVVLLPVFLAFIACNDDDDDNGAIDDDNNDIDDDTGDDDSVDDDDDDNDDNDDDDDTSPEPSDWPDNVQPLVGWFFTKPHGGGVFEWDALYYVEDKTATEVSHDGLPFFASGSMATAGVAFAADRERAVYLSGGAWTDIPDQPNCFDDGPTGLDLASFVDGTAYAVCAVNGAVEHFTGTTWLEVTTAPGGLHIDCVSSTECVIYGYDALYLFDGTTAENVAFPAGRVYTEMVAMRGDGAIFGVFFPENDPESCAHLFRYANGQWTQDERLGTACVFNPVLSRIDSRYVAIAATRAGESATWVLDGNVTLIDPDWPRFTGLAFAAGGAGLGILNAGDLLSIQQIDGLDLMQVFEVDFNSGVLIYPYFLLAADAD